MFIVVLNGWGEKYVFVKGISIEWFSVFEVVINNIGVIISKVLGKVSSKVGIF